MQRISIGIVAIMIATAAPAATIRVGTGSSADFSTIQAAVNAAESGDVIQIDQGTYREQVRIIGKDLTLLGTQTSTDGGYPAIVPTTLKPSGQFVGGREITALLLVKDAWVDVRELRLGGVSLTVTERRKADLLAAVAVLGSTAGFDLRNSRILSMNKGNVGTPRIVGFPTDCVGPLRDPDRGVAILAIDTLSLSVTNTSMTNNADGIIAACVVDISIQGNVIAGTVPANEEIGVTIGGNFARVVQNELGQHTIDILVKGNGSRIFNNSSLSPSEIGIQLEGDDNISGNQTVPPRGWRRK
jgi:hypothetical protein